MKLSAALPLALMFIPLCASAQTSAFWNVEAQPPSRAVPAIKLIKPAEVLAADVTIVATSRNSGEQALAFSTGLGLFRAEVARTPNLTIKVERTEQGGGAPSYLSSGKFETNRSVAEVSLLLALSGDLDSTGAAQLLRALISRVKLPSDVAIKIESLRVEVREPDSLRETLLKAIADDCGRLQNLFQASPIEVTGLENAVQQRPLNDREVVVFIPYTFSIGGAKH